MRNANQFVRMREFFVQMVAFVGIATIVTPNPLASHIGITLILLSLTHHIILKCRDVPVVFTILIHLFGVYVWVYIQDIINRWCSTSVFSRMSVLFILFELWIATGIIFSKLIRNRG